MRWKLKILVQFVLAHVPFGERANHLLQKANRNAQARMRHLEQRVTELTASIAELRSMGFVEGATVVEIGTGWCPAPTLLLSLAGAREIHTYDHVRHARLNLTREFLEVCVRKSADIADGLGLTEPDLRAQCQHMLGLESLEEIFDSRQITYQAPGDGTRTGQADRSADLFFSHAVLEHVPEEVAADLIREARRILRRSGCFYALIGLHDHYAGFDRSVSKVNFLQYPEWAWRLFVKNSISYHNRMREREFMDMIEAENGQILRRNSTIDPADLQRVKQMRLDSRFRRFTPEECAVTQSEIFASFPAEVA